MSAAAQSLLAPRLHRRPPSPSGRSSPCPGPAKPQEAASRRLGRGGGRGRPNLDRHASEVGLGPIITQRNASVLPVQDDSPHPGARRGKGSARGHAGPAALARPRATAPCPRARFGGKKSGLEAAVVLLAGAMRGEAARR